MERQAVRGILTDPLRVAIATEDGENSDVHFGKLSRLQIYEYDPRTAQFEYAEVRKIAPEAEGSYAPGEGRGCADPVFMDAVIRTLSDCEYLLLEKIGPRPARVLLREGINILEKGGKVNESLLQLSSFVTEKRKAASERFTGLSQNDDLEE